MERTALLDAATAAAPAGQPDADSTPLVTQDAVAAAAGAPLGQTSAPPEPVTPEAAAPEPPAEAASDADTSEPGGDDEDAQVSSLLKEVKNPFSDAVQAQEQERQQSDDYQRGLEDARKQLLGERQQETRRNVSGLITDFVDNGLRRALTSVVLEGDEGARYSLQPDEAQQYVDKLMPELNKLRQNLYLPVFSEVREFMYGAGDRLFGDDDDERKAWREELSAALEGADPLSKDSITMATLVEHTARYSKAYKELEASVRKRERDAYEAGSRAGILTGLKAPRGDGPTVAANGTAPGAPKEPPHNYAWYMALKPSERREFDKAHPEELKRIMASPEARARAQR